MSNTQKRDTYRRDKKGAAEEYQHTDYTRHAECTHLCSWLQKKIELVVLPYDCCMSIMKQLGDENEAVVIQQLE